MRASPPASPCAISSAGAEAVRGHEAELSRCDGVAAARHQHGAGAVDGGPAGGPLRKRQQRMTGAPVAVVGDRLLVRHDLALGVGERAPVTRRRRPEEGAVRVLGRHLEARGGTGAAGSTVPPSRSGGGCARAAARGRGRGTRPRPGSAARAAATPSSAGSARTIASSGSSSRAARSSIARRSASACATDGGPAKTAKARSSIGSRRNTDAPQRRGTTPNAAADPRVRDPLDRRLVVRVAAQRPGRQRQVERERDADDGHARLQRALELDGARPARASRSSRAATRPSAARSASAAEAASRTAGPPCSTDSAADTTTTRSVSTSAESTRSAGADLDRALVLDVVDDQPPAEAAAELGQDELPDLARRRAPLQPARDEDRLPLERDPGALELLDGGDDRDRPRVVVAPGIGSAGGSTTIVARPPRRRERPSGSPASGKRSASATASGMSAIRPVGGGGCSTIAVRRARSRRGAAGPRAAGRAPSAADEPVQPVARRPEAERRPAALSFEVGRAPVGVAALVSLFRRPGRTRPPERPHRAAPARLGHRRRDRSSVAPASPSSPSTMCATTRPSSSATKFAVSPARRGTPPTRPAPRPPAAAACSTRPAARAGGRTGLRSAATPSRCRRGGRARALVGDRPDRPRRVDLLAAEREPVPAVELRLVFGCDLDEVSDAARADERVAEPPVRAGSHGPCSHTSSLPRSSTRSSPIAPGRYPRPLAERPKTLTGVGARPRRRARRASPISSSSTATTSPTAPSSRCPRSSRRATGFPRTRCSASRTCSSSCSPTTGRRASPSRGTRGPSTAPRPPRPPTSSTRRAASRCRTCCASSSRTSGRSSRPSATATSSSRAGRPTT